MEVFNPQLRVQKATRVGPMWRTEPLFPNYLFARFALAELSRRVRYADGVSDIVHFGERWIFIPDPEMEELRVEWNKEGGTETLSVPVEINPGDTVRLSGRLFHGIEATVLALLPARKRVKVLLEFLGGLQEAEVDAAQVVPIASHPLAA